MGDRRARDHGDGRQRVELEAHGGPTLPPRRSALALLHRRALGEASPAPLSRGGSGVCTRVRGPRAQARADHLAVFADYAGVAFTADQQARLAAVFPTGVCDWTKRGVSQVPARGWTTFEAGPGGRPIDPVPGALGG